MCISFSSNWSNTFGHTKCISSTSIKTNTYLLHLRWIHTILCKIGHMIQIVPETPISVSGHETRSTAIPKLGKTQISVSGHETQSNRLYGSTTIQSLLFLKIIENCDWFPKQYLLGFFILDKQLANISDREFLFLCNTLLLHSLLLWRES